MRIVVFPLLWEDETGDLFARCGRRHSDGCVEDMRGIVHLVPRWRVLERRANGTLVGPMVGPPASQS